MFEITIIPSEKEDNGDKLFAILDNDKTFFIFLA